MGHYMIQAKSTESELSLADGIVGIVFFPPYFPMYLLKKTFVLIVLIGN